MKKGFTLIELLAVLVILVIIMAIATPIILGIIDDSRKSADVATVGMIVDAAETLYSTASLNNDASLLNKFKNEGDIFSDLTMSNKPENAVVVVNDKGEISVAMYENDICYIKEYESNEISSYTETTKEKCLTKTYNLIKMTTADNFKIKLGNFAYSLTSIIFEKNINEAEYNNATNKWDFSEKGDSSVVGYIKDSVLYVQANGVIQAPVNTSKMFQNFSVTYLDLTNFNTTGVTSMAYMFNGMKNIQKLDLSGFDTSSVINMQQMFDGTLKNLTELNLTDWDTLNVTNMYGMFANLTAITELDLSSFESKGNVDLRWMFSGASNLKSVDFSNFDTSNFSTDLSYMFYGASQLVTGYAKTATDVSYFNTQLGREIFTVK